jgi:hypothetical protein
MKHFRALFSGGLFFVSAIVGSAPAFASPTYELAMTAPGASGITNVFRVNVASGAVSNVSNTPIVNIADPQPIPPGNYRLFVATSADGKTFWLYRLETESGRTWFIANNTWREVTAK